MLLAFSCLRDRVTKCLNPNPIVLSSVPLGGTLCKWFLLQFQAVTKSLVCYGNWKKHLVCLFWYCVVIVKKEKKTVALFCSESSVGKLFVTPFGKRCWRLAKGRVSLHKKSTSTNSIEPLLSRGKWTLKRWWLLTGLPPTLCTAIGLHAPMIF